MIVKTMKYFSALVLIGTLLQSCSTAKNTSTENVIEQDGKSYRTVKGSRMNYRVTIAINAKPSTIWSYLVDAEGYKDWNTTIDTLRGNIVEGEKIDLYPTINPGKKFTIKIDELVPNQYMIWKSGNIMFKGIRTFTLTDRGNGVTDFTMSENYSGLILPMIKKSLPDFRPAFEGFAADLKKVSELNN